MSASNQSLQDYLKRYKSKEDVEKRKEKKQQKKEKKSAKEKKAEEAEGASSEKAEKKAMGVVVVDADPDWRKPVELKKEDDDDDGNSTDEDKPVVEEDIEVKRMKRLELLRAKRPFNSISEDGSGWVPIGQSPPKGSNYDMSPPRRQRTLGESESMSVRIKTEDKDLSPPRERRKRHHTPSPEPETNQDHLPTSRGLDLSPPRKSRNRDNAIVSSPRKGGKEVEADLSPPRKSRKEVHADISSPRRSRMEVDGDLSPPRKSRKEVHADISSPRKSRMEVDGDLSPPRKSRKEIGADPSPPRKSRNERGADLSQPRKSMNERGADLSPPRKIRKDAGDDLSPPRRKAQVPPGPLKEQQKVGLISGRDISNEITKTKKDEFSRFQQMDPSVSGREATPVFRDKKTGQRISKEELLKSQRKVDEKPKEIKLEWGKGLAQKREAETNLEELEREKEKPFARTRDDPELDRMMKEAVRWGDPMAHLVKKKYPEPVLPNLGDDERMKESGFIIPQDIPNHSWLRRGLDAALNRYGIKPGRHWDGVDRSNGFEKGMFKRKNEKQATETEAYLWSVADM